MANPYPSLGHLGPQQMTFSQIRSAVLTFLMNTNADTNSYSWTTAELNAYINDGILYTQQVTEYYEDFFNVPVVAGQTDYTLPANYYAMKRGTFDREYLFFTNEYELDRDRPDWRTAVNNTPIRFYAKQYGTMSAYPPPVANGISYTFSSEFGTFCNITLDDGVTIDTQYTIAGGNNGTVIEYTDTNGALNLFVQDPYSGAVGDYGVLTAYSTDESNLGWVIVRMPDPLVNDGDYPQLPAHCHYALVFYAVMRAFMRDGEFQDLEASMSWQAMYQDWMESVLEVKARNWPTRVKAFEPYESGDLFAKRTVTIGPPTSNDLNAAY